MKMKEEIHWWFENSTMTIQQIADYLGSTYKVVYSYTSKNFSKAFRMERKRLNYKRSKTGELNPMFGKKGDAHHNYIGVVSDNKGYLMRLKPEWYTGRKGSKHIYEHHYQYCVANSLTCIPKGYIVHHKDQDPYNNDPDNLLMMTMSDHTKLHCRLRRAETIRKE